VLTAIVISFGMSALVVVLALRSYLESGGDEIDVIGEAEVARRIERDGVSDGEARR